MARTKSLAGFVSLALAGALLVQTLTFVGTPAAGAERRLSLQAQAPKEHESPPLVEGSLPLVEVSKGNAGLAAGGVSLVLGFLVPVIGGVPFAFLFAALSYAGATKNISSQLEKGSDVEEAAESFENLASTAGTKALELYNLGAEKVNAQVKSSR